MASKSKAAVISITEIWLDSSITEGEIHIDDYLVLHRDRNRSQGGVCVYIRNDFAFTSRSDIQMDSDEIIFVEFLLPKTKPITVGTAYRPPKQNDFLNNFKEILTHLRTDCEIIILGDFNISGLQRSSSIFKSYANILKLLNLDQIINEPTKITPTTSSLPDYILCNNKEKNCQSGTISISLSDHFMTYCTRKISKGQINKHNYVKIRSLKNYTKEEFILKLTCADLIQFFNGCNINIALSALWDIFFQL